MMGKSIAIVSLSLAVGCLWGCGPARPSKYYQIQALTGLTPAKGTDVYPVTLVLAPISASHLYREDRVVYSSGEVQLGTYQFERWAVPPTEMIQETLLRDLRESGRYQSVQLLSSSGSSGDFLLKGRLYDFKEVSGSEVLARLSIEFELRNQKSGSTVWTYAYTHDEPVAKKDISHVISALDQNAQRCAADFMTKLDQYFASNSGQPSSSLSNQH